MKVNKNIILIILLILFLTSAIYIFVVAMPSMFIDETERLSGQMMIPYNYTDRNFEESHGIAHGRVGFYKTIVCPVTNKTEDSVVYGDTIAQRDPYDLVEGVPRLNSVTFFYCREHHVLFSYP